MIEQFFPFLEWMTFPLFFVLFRNPAHSPHHTINVNMPKGLDTFLSRQPYLINCDDIRLTPCHVLSPQPLTDSHTQLLVGEFSRFLLFFMKHSFASMAHAELRPFTSNACRIVHWSANWIGADAAPRSVSFRKQSSGRYDVHRRLLPPCSGSDEGEEFFARSNLCRNGIWCERTIRADGVLRNGTAIMQHISVFS